ncbi:ABC transporter permease [Paenibacillus sp. CGMCC 1.16610]|uniref:ABC transporter permease n=2 Tax=Paenibacillus TaxID=44249 RepID=A0ABU6DED6_9BACL|nr:MULTISPECIES: ABC transporter permease [Paenibacillus]MBA2938441.1 ABC transporter permease [Paenibacillus sp. CGMCC 1.16610]MCY9658731.1 ABC transporter permease [Paenibacillus anseongense]MEB4796044.1 ABC transporter permease [Paenibacillus chondroitinus]MVQ37499.1 ABC transporter permease subunit [Paenibacillus anseongense]
MLHYILKRIVLVIPVIFFISMIVFYIIQLPPGDYVSTYAAKMSVAGDVMSDADIAAMRASLKLDQPWFFQYLAWMSNMITNFDFGYSFSYNKPVTTVISQYMGLTIVVSLVTMAFTYAVAVPIGIYCAVKQYSIGDYIFSAVGFLGMATPHFLMAIILMYLSYVYFGDPLLGLFSSEFVHAGWSFDKVLDLLKHMIIPVIVIGLANTAELIRVMRGQMLDELNKPNVVTARAKGLSETKILIKYPTRAAMNPIVSTIGWSLTSIFTGSTITAIVLNLPIQGPVMYNALLAQDMYLAGTWLLFMAVLTVLGTLISDILLAWLDPKIRTEFRGM